MSLCHKLRFSNPHIFVAQCRRPKIFQTMNSGRSNNQSLKYQRLRPSSYQDLGIRKFELVTKTQFHCLYFEKLIPSPSLLRLIILMRRGGEAVCTYPQACRGVFFEFKFLFKIFLLELFCILYFLCIRNTYCMSICDSKIFSSTFFIV